MNSWLRREAEQTEDKLEMATMDYIKSSESGWPNDEGYARQPRIRVLEQFGLCVLAEVERRLKHRAPSDSVDAVVSVMEACRLVHSLRESDDPSR